MRENTRMRTKRYPSDITREQFLVILPILEAVRRKTKPRTVDLYEVFCAVLYLRRIRGYERIAELMGGVLFKDGEPVKEEEQEQQQLAA